MSGTTKTGRPTLCDATITAKIASYVRAGATQHIAARAAGIAMATFHNWMNRGAEGEEPFAAFREAVAEASAQARMAAEIEVRKRDPLAYLTRGPHRDRGDPENPGWVGADRVQISGQINHAHAHALIPPHRIAALLTLDQVKQLETIQQALLAAGPDPESAGGGEGEPQP